MASFNLPKPVSIQVVVDGQPHHFTSYWQAHHFFWKLGYDQDRLLRQEAAERMFNDGVKYVYQAKQVLEDKFGFWVAKSKDNKFNIRKDSKPFIFGKRKMFGLNGKELLDFYERFVKVVALV